MRSAVIRNLPNALLCALVITGLSSFHADRPAIPAPLPATAGYHLKTVVIDAGHGGHDQGCSGKSTLEKDVALGIALKLGAMIEKSCPDVKVIYTRKTDVFVELYERAEIANRNDADLFICIHCNANPSSAPYGTETYVMGLHKTEANLNVAKRENDVILMEDNYNEHYDGYNPNDPASHIIFSLNQHAYMDQSILFASKVEDAFHSAKRYDRGVKQAGFLVLWKTTMPSVLIETGFLTNPNEEKFLASANGQSTIAKGICDAFVQYKIEMEKSGGVISENEISTIQKDMDAADAGDPADDKGNSVQYAVQFYASGTALKTTSSKFAGLHESVSCVKEDGLYKYRIGPWSSYDTAVEKQATARKAGFPDAFVLALKDGKRISLDDARASPSH